MIKTAICLDLDGTITKQEILPIIASSLGIHEEIQALTEATIRGHIPFESSFKLRVRLLREFPINRVRESIRAILLYDDILKFIKMYPENCFVVTGNLDVWIQELMQKLGIVYFSSKALIENGEVAGIEKILDKGMAVKKLKTKFDRVIAVGEGMNDISMFDAADISIAYGATHKPVKTALEICDLIVNDEGALCRLLITLL